MYVYIYIYEESFTAYVFLILQMRKSLQNFTLCLKAFMDLICPYSIFSYPAVLLNEKLQCSHLRNKCHSPFLNSEISLHTSIVRYTINHHFMW